MVSKAIRHDSLIHDSSTSIIKYRFDITQDLCLSLVEIPLLLRVSYLSYKPLKKNKLVAVKFHHIVR